MDYKEIISFYKNLAFFLEMMCFQAFTPFSLHNFPINRFSFSETNMPINWVPGNSLWFKGCGWLLHYPPHITLLFLWAYICHSIFSMANSLQLSCLQNGFFWVMALLPQTMGTHVMCNVLVEALHCCWQGYWVASVDCYFCQKGHRMILWLVLFSMTGEHI